MVASGVIDVYVKSLPYRWAAKINVPVVVLPLNVVVVQHGSHRGQQQRVKRDYNSGLKQLRHKPRKLN